MSRGPKETNHNSRHRSMRALFHFFTASSGSPLGAYRPDQQVRELLSYLPPPFIIEPVVVVSRRRLPASTIGDGQDI